MSAFVMVKIIGLVATGACGILNRTKTVISDRNYGYCADKETCFADRDTNNPGTCIIDDSDNYNDKRRSTALGRWDDQDQGSFTDNLLNFIDPLSANFVDKNPSEHLGKNLNDDLLSRPNRKNFN